MSLYVILRVAVNPLLGSVQGHWLMKAQSEFAAASALISEASGIEFTEGSLREDLVRPNRDAKRAFARHYDGTNS